MMKLDQICSGFRVRRTAHLPELDAYLYEMEHEVTGAQLVWLDRMEENKTFSIAFPTYPEDDTGVFHILEHSILCGSERYPLKAPFAELLKGSMSTFLNAMTFPDRTLFPVSSRSEQEMINLMRVYMDAVLHPLIYTRPAIFLQEGWRYEISTDGALQYKGVVLNEMKGAFASADTLLTNEINRRLFPDTCYRFVSGGDPKYILDLKYQEFLKAHRRFYHPSNARIFLDGALQIEKILDILDREYFSGYTRIPSTSPVPLQTSVDAGTSEIRYELPEGETSDGRGRIAEAFVVGTYAERERLTALQALMNVICGDNEAPLKRRFLDSALAKDVNMSLYTGVLQPWLSVDLRDVAEGREEEVSAALWDELRCLSDSGLDHGRILAVLDNLEFQERQRDYGRTPQGIALAFQVMESWLYGGAPEANLSVGTLYENLRRKCTEGYFESLLKQTTIDNFHRCRVVMRPSSTLGQEQKEQESARLKGTWEGWSIQERDEVFRQQIDLAAWQNTTDSPKQLALLPHLGLCQIPQCPDRLPTDVEMTPSGCRILWHRQKTGGISYLNFYFSLDDLSTEAICKASLLARLLGNVDTSYHRLDALRREINSQFGDLWFTVEAYGKRGQPDACHTFLCVSCSVLDSRIERAMELLLEIMTCSKVGDAARVYPFLCQQSLIMREQMTTAGHNAAMIRTMAGLSVEGAVYEYAGGISFFQWMDGMARDFQKSFPFLKNELTAMAKKIFCSNRMTVSITGDNDSKGRKAAESLARMLPKGICAPFNRKAIHLWGPRREAFIIPADVSFAAVGGCFPASGTGAARVLGHVISLEYLWNTVRVQGGAYGTGMVIRENGTAGFYSYRDPSPCRTLSCCRDASDFLRKVTSLDLTGMVIGTAAELSPLLTSRLRGKTADSYYWRGISDDDRKRVWEEVLGVSQRELTDLAPEVKTLAEKGSITVLGPHRQIDQCTGLFDSIGVL